MKRVLGIAVVLLLMAAAALPVWADGAHVLTVDGTEYSPTKVVGNDADPTVHYETPDSDPLSAFSERHVWDGNGSEHLPCEFGIHWIDNGNNLTVSHCLGDPSTTTTTIDEGTTTTIDEGTTTTIDEGTTTTVQEETTTTVVETTTTDGGTTVPETLPFTGVGDSPGLWVSAAVGLLALGGLAFRVARGMVDSE